MLVATLAALLAAAPAPVPTRPPASSSRPASSRPASSRPTPASLPRAALQCAATSGVGLGPVDAPVQLTVYVDPLTPAGALSLWIEVRRLVSDLRGDLRVQVLPVSGIQRDPATEALLRWFWAASDAGAQEAALRLLDRDGRDRLALRLARPGGPAALAAEIGKPGLRFDFCLDRRIEAARRALREHQQTAGGFAGRPPLFALGERLVFEDNGTLERVRGEVSRELQRLRSDRPPPGRNSWPPARPGVSLRLIRPPAEAGMLVGGVGLPHRLVVFVEHDEHPNLGNLGPVLEYRRQHPGRLAIQIIARGTTAAARQLRLRLCGAQKLGMELDYLRRLAQGPMTRGLATAEPVPLTVRLDEAAEAHGCEMGEPELEPAPGGARGLPDGAWLDGTAVGQGDLEAISVRIVGLEAAQRPLDAVFSAAAPAEL